MPTTPWQTGRLDQRVGTSQLLFGRTYEDARIEAGVFPAGGSVFCIAAAGDTALSLSGSHEVTAVDINPSQIAYARKRAAGAPRLDGVSEKWMRRARMWLPAAGWSRSAVRTFLELDDPPGQLAYWRGTLLTRRFRCALACLLSRRFLAMMYPRRLLEALPRRFDRVLIRRFERTWSNHGNRDNPFAWALLSGDAPETQSPARMAPIRFLHADAAEYLESCPRGSFDGISLSNVLDGATDGYAVRLRAAARRAAAPGSAIVERTFSEPRIPIRDNLAQADRSALWGAVTATRVED